MMAGDIGNGAFYYCTALITFSAKNMEGDISNSAFENCEELTSVYARKMKATLGERAFNGCTKLTSITLGAAGTTSYIDTRAFEDFTTTGNCNLTFTKNPDGTINTKANTWTVGTKTWTFKSITTNSDAKDPASQSAKTP